MRLRCSRVEHGTAPMSRSSSIRSWTSRGTSPRSPKQCNPHVHAGVQRMHGSSSGVAGAGSTSGGAIFSGSGADSSSSGSNWLHCRRFASQPAACCRHRCVRHPLVSQDFCLRWCAVAVLFDPPLHCCSETRPAIISGIYPLPLRRADVATHPGAAPEYEHTRVRIPCYTPCCISYIRRCAT